MKLHLKYRLYTYFYTICLLLIFLDYWIFNRLTSFRPSYRLTGYWLPSLFNFFLKWKQLKKEKKLICILKNVHSYTFVYILLNLINSQSYWKKNEVCVFQTACHGWVRTLPDCRPIYWPGEQFGIWGLMFKDKVLKTKKNKNKAYVHIIMINISWHV